MNSPLARRWTAALVPVVTVVFKEGGQSELPKKARDLDLESKGQAMQQAAAGVSALEVVCQAKEEALL